MKHLLYLFLVLSIVSCKTVKTIPVEAIKTTVNHDTLIMNHQLYDSIYIFSDHYVDRSKDTVYIRDTQLQYKYKLLRDTIYKSRVDSIPVIKEVKGTCAEHSRSIPWYTKLLAWIGATVLLLAIISVMHRYSQKILQKD